MPRQINRLVPLTIGRTTEPGMYPDGGGLYLRVTPTGVKSWIFRYAVDGKDRQMGLGPLHTVNLTEARAKAKEYRQCRLEGRDPLDIKRAAIASAKAAKARRMTFRQCSEAFVEAHKAAWDNEKSEEQWASTLLKYAYPEFGDVPVQDVDLPMILKAIQPIWATKNTTASRLRGRIETILDWATVHGFRTGANPARWRGHLAQVLPAPTKVHKVKHHPALPYVEAASFMSDLREVGTTAAKALEFTILTTARTSEVLNMPWSEINLDNGVWIVPAERMKAEKEHRVPLSKPALAILREFNKSRSGNYVFPGRKKDKPLSNMAMSQVLKRMKRSDITVHGFRSSFRDWAAETTTYPGEMAEMALAHTVGDKVEAAYRRGDMFMKRRRMMEHWASQCDVKPNAKRRSDQPMVQTEQVAA